MYSLDDHSSSPPPTESGLQGSANSMYEEEDRRPLFDPRTGDPIVYEDTEPSMATQAPEAPDTLAAEQSDSDDAIMRPNLRERGLTIARTALRAGRLAVRSTVDYLLHTEGGQTILQMGAATLAIGVATASEFLFPGLGHELAGTAGSAIQGLGHLASGVVTGIETLPTLGISHDQTVNQVALGAEAGVTALAGTVLAGVWAADHTIPPHSNY